MSQTNEVVEKTLKMKAHQAFTAITTAALIVATGIASHGMTLRAHDIAVADGLGKVFLTAVGAAALSFAVVYFTRPIPFKTKDVIEGRGHR